MQTSPVGGRTEDTESVVERVFTGSETTREPVEDPFPDSGIQGVTLGDPLNTTEYVVELDASENGSYRLEVDGDVLGVPDSATVSETRDSVSGEVAPDHPVTIEIRGVVTGIETDSSVAFSSRAQ